MNTSSGQQPSRNSTSNPFVYFVVLVSATVIAAGLITWFGWGSGGAEETTSSSIAAGEDIAPESATSSSEAVGESSGSDTTTEADSETAGSDETTETGPPPSPGGGSGNADSDDERTTTTTAQIPATPTELSAFCSAPSSPEGFGLVDAATVGIRNADGAIEVDIGSGNKVVIGTPGRDLIHNKSGSMIVCAGEGMDFITHDGGATAMIHTADGIGDRVVTYSADRVLLVLDSTPGEQAFHWNHYSDGNVVADLGDWDSGIVDLSGRAVGVVANFGVAISGGVEGAIIQSDDQKLHIELVGGHQFIGTDSNDRFDASGLDVGQGLFLSGGLGDDTVIGTPYDDRLWVGAPEDVPGDTGKKDRIEGGSGRDQCKLRADAVHHGCETFESPFEP